MEAKLKGVSKSIVDVSAGEIAGDGGKGVEVGDNGWSMTGIGAGVGDLDNSAAASFARSLSSRFDLGVLASGRLLLFSE
jgi:hypothetical protein